MIERPGVVALARAANAAFFLATSAYCLLAYIPFAYRVFLKPEVLSWIPDFVAVHSALFWLVLLVTALTLRPHLGPNLWLRSEAGRPALTHWIARAYLAVGTLVGVGLIVRPLLGSIGNSPRSFVIALLALIPPVWLAVFDHLAAAPPSVVMSGERHALRTCVAAALCVWGVYAVGVPFRLKQVIGIDMPPLWLLMSAALSAVVHLFVFMAVFLTLVIVSRVAKVARAGGSFEYWLLVTAAAATLSLTIFDLVFRSLTFVGLPAIAAAIVVGGTIALAWSGVARWHGAASGAKVWTAQQLFLAPIGDRRSRLTPAATLAFLPVAAYVLTSATAALDWNFIIQKTGVLLVWLIAFASLDALIRRDVAIGGAALAVVPVVALLLFQGTEVLSARARSMPGGPVDRDFLLDRYASLDLSYRLIRDLRVSHRGETAEFYMYLQANTLVAPPRVSPASIEFAHPVRAGVRPPHIFLFVIDSLRRDYLSPYNPSVTFTPSIAAFASESFVFRRAFTRYSGTGLAVPAIWAGGMLIHMIEQHPFDSRDALLKLLDGFRYRPIISVDSVMRDLLPARRGIEELDRGVASMQSDFCRTVQELEDKLSEPVDDNRPVFSYMLPQNVHIAVASRRKVPSGAAYPGFFAPVAESVRQADRCVGEFITFLRHSNRYEESIVILTADHGDSLGEEGRWGHAYFMVPEVMRIPLIVHLPASLRAAVHTDLNRVVFSTDMTPTLYALTGNPPADLGRLFGSPLFAAPGAALSVRRDESFLLASSYGAVYGMLRHNGRRLYATNAVDGRDDVYDMSGEGPGRRVAMTEASTALNRRLIREQLEELAALNHYVQQP